MEKQPIYMSFATQKGGAGKTVFTILAASWLHYRLGYNVAVIDCDFPQNSIEGIRKRDLAKVANDAYFKTMAKKQFSALQKKAYPTISCDVQQALRFTTKGDAEVEQIIAAAGFGDSLDVILFDLPGTVNQSELDVESNVERGVMTLLACMDFIFCPITNDRSVIESSVQKFATRVKQEIIEQRVGVLQQLFLFWTAVDGRESTRIYDIANTGFKLCGFPVFETTIPFRANFKKEITDSSEVFKCTLFPVTLRLAQECRIDKFMHELCKKIQLKS
jgi:cellulose biosynthesis protein BcsQ